MKETEVKNAAQNDAPDQWPDKVKLGNARIVTAVLVISGFVIPFYWVLHPVTGYMLWLRCLVFPVVTLIAYRAFDGYLILAGGKKTKRFPVIFALIFPAVFFGLEAYARFTLLTQVPLIIPTLLFALVFAFAIIFKNTYIDREMSKRAKYFAIVFISVPVAYVFALNYNASGVLSQSLGCPAVVAGKYVETWHGRGNKPLYFYHLTLKPWQYSRFSNDVTTTKIWYDITLPGDSVQVDVYFGLLSAPYYTLKQTAYRRPVSLPI